MRTLPQAEICYLRGNCKEDSDPRNAEKWWKWQDAVEEVESCSACYGYLIPALDMLETGRTSGETGYRRYASARGPEAKQESWEWVHCTRQVSAVMRNGCPPTENQIYQFLKEYIENFLQ